MLNVRPVTIMIVIGVFIIFILGFISFYSAFIQPRKEAIQLTENQIDTQQLLIEKYKNRNRDDEVNTVDVNKDIPANFSMENFLQYIEKAQKSSDCTVTDVSFHEGEKESSEAQADEQQESEGLKTLTASLTVSSPGLSELIQFLRNMEIREEVIMVNSLALSQQTGQSFTFSVEMSAFYAPPKAGENKQTS